MPPKKELLTKEDIKKMKKEFLSLDCDGDGTISSQEISDVLRSMRVKLKLTETDITNALKELDSDGSGTIDLKEYFKRMKNKTNHDLIHRALVIRSVLRKDFIRFDEDKSGFISKDELIQVIKERTGRELSAYQIDEMLKESDENSDGKISFEEFVILMTK